MKSNFIKRIMALTIISTTLLAVIPIGASAEWRHNNDNTWSYYNNGNLLKNTWFYDKNYGKNYYLNSDGIMATNTIIDGKYAVGADGAWIQNTTIATNNSNIPISIPSSWNNIGNNKYSINNRSVISYSVSDMTGWTQESVLNDLKRITYQQGNYDSDMGLVTYNGNNGYAYSYTTITKDSIEKVLFIVIFKNNKHYDFVFVSKYGNYNEDRKELENVLNTTLNI